MPLGRGFAPPVLGPIDARGNQRNGAGIDHILAWAMLRIGKNCQGDF
jgi:hypothetical protein